MAGAIPTSMSTPGIGVGGDTPMNQGSPPSLANLANSARAASPIPGVYDGASSKASKRQKDKTLEPMKHQGRGLMRVVGNDELDAAEKRSIDLSKVSPEVATDLANYIRQRFEKAVRHRRVISVDDELIRDMRAYNGQYDPGKLQEIESFGGSAVYTRLMSMKCRGATALLRNVYMNSDRPWTLEPTSDPVVPDDIDQHVATLVHQEVLSANSQGQKVPQDAIEQRLHNLYEAVKLNERRKAEEDAKDATRKIDKILEEGEFYHALSEFLCDLPVYKYAVVKGPITRRTTSLKWDRKKKMHAHEEAKFFWQRVSPWDVWFSPGATQIENTEVFERQRLSVMDLYNLIGLPGYREEDIRAIIQAYEGRGFKEWIQIFDYERAQMEGRNNVLDDTFINAIEFHGHVLGRYLMEYNVPGVNDPFKPYFITAWMVDKRIFKVMMNPSPRLRVPYYVTSFDKLPGTLYGNGIPALANDLTDVINATLRALVNNISISSGPQVVYDEELISPTQDDTLSPWKRWKYTGDPANPNRNPITFFQPQSNAQELMGIIDKFSVMLDDVSTIPRYLTGGGAGSGAGRTASGLSMLINNANKTLQNVADNIDNDIFEPLMQMLYDFIMLTDATGMLRGDEKIIVDGVRQAAKQEQDLTRQMEFLNTINNPNYQALIGPGEVAKILQKIADNIGMEVKIKQPDDLPGAPPPGIYTPPPPPAPPAPPPPHVNVNLAGNLPNAALNPLAGLPPGAGGGPNPTGNNTPMPNDAAPQGAGGHQGVPPAPQVAPVNTVASNVGHG
jgi:hypothetical protein